MHWSGIHLPCSFTTNSYPTTLDHLQFQEYAMLCPSCYSFLLALLFTRMIFPFLILLTPSELNTNISSRKPSLNLHAFLCTSRTGSKFRWPLRLIVFSFVVWQVAGSASMSNSPEEQMDVVPYLCMLLLYN